MAKLIISDYTSDGENYAIGEDGEVKAILNKETKEKGYTPISEAKKFAHSLIGAMIKRDKLIPDMINITDESTAGRSGHCQADHNDAATCCR